MVFVLISILVLIFILVLVPVLVVALAFVLAPVLFFVLVLVPVLVFVLIFIVFFDRCQLSSSLYWYWSLCWSLSCLARDYRGDRTTKTIQTSSCLLRTSLYSCFVWSWVVVLHLSQTGSCLLDSGLYLLYVGLGL